MVSKANGKAFHHSRFFSSVTKETAKKWNISFEFILIRGCLYIYEIKCTGPAYRYIYVTYLDLCITLKE